MVRVYSSGGASTVKILPELDVVAETFRLFNTLGKKANKNLPMENLFEMSFTVTPQETFCNRWVAAASDGALTLTGLAQG